MLYWPLFLIRRAVFVAVPAFSDDPGLQVVLLVSGTVGYHAWYCTRRPHLEFHRRLLEGLNEVCLVLLLLHVTAFSDYNLNEVSKFKMGFSLGAILAIIVIINVGYEIHAEVVRQRQRKYLIWKRECWRVYLAERKEIEEYNKVIITSNKVTDELMEMDPDMKKPKLEKQRNVPMSYGKRVMIKPTGLAPIKEEELSQLEHELNDALYDELGNFGDIVEASRKQILAGYVRPKGKYRAPKKGEVLPVAPLPDLIEDFAETFEESSRRRWTTAQQREEAMEPPSQILKAASDAKEVATRLGRLAAGAAAKASKYLKEAKIFDDSSEEEKDKNQEDQVP